MTFITQEIIVGHYHGSRNPVHNIRLYLVVHLPMNTVTILHCHHVKVHSNQEMTMIALRPLQEVILYIQQRISCDQIFSAQNDWKWQLIVTCVYVCDIINLYIKEMDLKLMMTSMQFISFSVTQSRKFNEDLWIYKVAIQQVLHDNYIIQIL